jgi:hypothetical protein
MTIQKLDHLRITNVIVQAKPPSAFRASESAGCFSLEKDDDNVSFLTFVCALAFRILKYLFHHVVCLIFENYKFMAEHGFED